MDWKRIFYSWFFAVVGFCIHSLSAQPIAYHFERFGDEQGLPGNLFRLMLQDQQGVLWMGGADGLASYDGSNITLIRHSEVDSTSISGNYISALYEDRLGRLWAGTFGRGLNVSDAGKIKFRQLHLMRADHDVFETEVIHQIVEDGRGNIWLAGNSLLIILTEQDGSFVQSTLLQDTPPFDSLSNPSALFYDQHGRMWIGTKSGLYVYDEHSNRMYRPGEIEEMPVSEIQFISADRNNRIWVGCDASPRLFFAEPEELHFAPFTGVPFQGNRNELQFTFDLDNRIWIAAFDEQVYGYDFRDSSLFLQSSVNSNVTAERFLRNPFVDHSGNVWLHAEGYLIYRYPKGFQNYLHPFAFHQSNSCISRVGDYLWMGYREEGAVRVDLRNGNTVHFSTKDKTNFIPADHIQGFFKVESGNTIIVCYGYVAVMNDKGNIIANYSVPGTNRDAYQDSRGRIWIGGFYGLYLFSETQGVIDTFKLPALQGDRRNFIQAIVEDAQGQIWLGSDLKGLAKLDPETGQFRQFQPIPDDPASMPTLSVLDIAIDQKNILWLATDVALIRFDPATYTFRSYNCHYGIANDYIASVICAHDGLIWVSTHAGISSFDPDTEQFVNYGREDGLINASYYSRSGFYGPDGKIFFGGKNGVDYFNPKDLRINPTPPLMHLIGIAVNNNKHFSAVDFGSSSNVINLSYKDNLVDIAIAGLHYAAQDQVHQFYRLDDLHGDWVDLGTQRHVLFSNLNPGDYTFRAKAVSSDGVWSRQELSFPIHVSPPFYETSWFRIMLGLLFIGFVFAFVKYRERRIHKKDTQEAAVARKITELEKRALQAQMNPHFIYNSMNSIQQFMVIHDFEGAMKYLTRFSRILRSVLNMSANQRIALSDEIKLIEDYLELENMRFPNKFSYLIKVSPELNIHTVEIPPFFIQPQVENAIRHGLLGKSSQGRLVISIDKEDPNLKITVEDNGIGRQASRAARPDSALHESKGLAIVQERLAHMHSQNGHHPFTVTDLYDADEKPAGTRVEIILPLD